MDFEKTKLTSEQLQSVENVVKWHCDDQKIIVCCKWVLSKFNFFQAIWGTVSPEFKAGNKDELKWKINLSSDFCYSPKIKVTDLKLKTQFFDLSKSIKCFVQISVLNENKELDTYKKFGDDSVDMTDPEKFVKTKYYEPSELPNKCLTIVVEILAVQGPQIEKIIQTDFMDFERLLEDEVFSDITLIINDKKIKAHKNILFARSPIFLELLKSQTSPNTNVSEINIKGVDYDIMKEILRFVYTGKVADLNAANAANFLKAATKFALTRLAEHCEEILGKILNKSNVTDILLLAESCNAQKLKEQAMEVFVNNLEKHNCTSELKKLNNSKNCLLIDVISASLKVF